MTTLVVSTASAWAMVGFWTIQLVHYPMLAAYSAHSPRAAASNHQRRITWLVGPLLAAEGLTALILLVDRPPTMGVGQAWLAAVLLGVALISTVLIQVPLHTRLAAAHDIEAAQRLIATNWIRTGAWTGRALVLAAVLIS